MANSFISYFYLTDKEIQPESGAIQLKTRATFGRKVLFRIKAPDSRNISLVGSFNSWNSEIDVMEKNEKGYFEIEKYLLAGIDAEL